MKDDLGDRMKLYESVEADRKIHPTIPIMVRLDGKCFSKFTAVLNRPFDKRLSDLMVDTTRFLVEKTNAVVGYTQSDEISLCLYSEDPNKELFFNGRIQKLTSVLASMTTAHFNRNLVTAIPEKKDAFAFFDCRVWSVPTLIEAANVFVWRELDATKNAVSMAAQHHFSHSELQGKHGMEMKEMLWSKGINFESYPTFFKRGTYIRRVSKETTFTTDEIARLPAKHAARSNPELKVTRMVVETIETPPIICVENKVDFLFNNMEPKLKLS